MSPPEWIRFPPPLRPRAAARPPVPPAARPSQAARAPARPSAAGCSRPPRPPPPATGRREHDGHRAEAVQRQLQGHARVQVRGEGGCPGTTALHHPAADHRRALGHLPDPDQRARREAGCHQDQQRPVRPGDPPRGWPRRSGRGRLGLPGCAAPPHERSVLDRSSANLAAPGHRRDAMRFGGGGPAFPAHSARTAASLTVPACRWSACRWECPQLDVKKPEGRACCSALRPLATSDEERDPGVVPAVVVVVPVVVVPAVVVVPVHGPVPAADLGSALRASAARSRFLASASFFVFPAIICTPLPLVPRRPPRSAHIRQ